MAPWLEPLQRWWHQLSVAFFGDVEKTRMLEWRASAMDTTEVIACAPTIRVRATVGPETMRRPEKRTKVRYPCDREVCCTMESADEPLKGRLRNLSVGGLGLVVPTHVEPGKTLVVELDDPLEVEPRVIAVTVVHTRPMPIRGWFLGCAFAHEMSEGDVRIMAEKLTP